MLLINGVLYHNHNGRVPILDIFLVLLIDDVYLPLYGLPLQIQVTGPPPELLILPVIFVHGGPRHILRLLEITMEGSYSLYS